MPTAGEAAAGAAAKVSPVAAKAPAADTPGAAAAGEAPAAAPADEPPAAAAEAGAAGAAAVSASGNGGLPPAGSGESAYGLAVEPAEAFGKAREASGLLHEALGRLKALRAASAGDGGATPAAPPEGFAQAARDLHRQLLCLRRAHRAMARAVEVGRAEEAAARRAADTEFAHLETRRYESACCRAAARRCRTFPTPQLSLLRPLLDGADRIGEDQEEQGIDSIGTLCDRLEAERVERARLADELEALEKEKTIDVESFLESQRQTNDVSEKLRAVERALEPVCELLDLRQRPASVAPRPGEEELARLPGPLRLVFNKFDVLAAYGGGDVAVRAEIPDCQPEKRQKLQNGDSAPVAGATVVVEINAPTECGAGQASVLIRFALPHPQLVSTSGERDGSDALLASLWPQEKAVAVPEGVSVDAGKPYGWAQVLSGLQERSLVAVPALLSAEGVTASDVLQRVREKLASAAEG